MRKNILRDDKGIALVVALMMLLVLTLIGINAITSTTYEASISGNERVGTDAFYASEAGIQVGLNKLPDPNPITRTKLGEDSYYWSGSPMDKGNPKSIQYIGRHWGAGFEIPSSGTTYEGTPNKFDIYQLNATGESFGAMKEIEVQVRYGPF